MSDQLQGKKIAFLVANEGVEQVELTSRCEAVEDAGAEVDWSPPKRARSRPSTTSTRATPSRRPASATPSAANYDGLVLPGGVANPDQLRTDAEAVAFVRGFFEAGKPVGAICHGPWTLIEADVVGAAR